MMLLAMVTVVGIATFMDMIMCRTLGIGFRRVGRKLMIVVVTMVMTMSVMGMPESKDSDQIDKKPQAAYCKKLA